MDEGVVGVDLAGAEDQYPGEPFRKVFSYARDAGLNVTIHAGEWAGPESVREAVEVLQARRLGHGVRALEDKEILKRVCEQKIAFEICVTSNCQSGVIAGVETHPLAELFRLCPNNTTINTDDPSVSAINLTDEMVVAMESLGFSTADVKQQIMNAANAAFLSDTERAALVKRLWTALYESDTRKQQAQSQS
jgi:adenosine deaminase